MSDRPASWLRQAFSDETGWGSFSRIALAATLLFTFGVISVDVAGRAVGSEVYGLLGGTILALIAASGRYELASTFAGVGKAVAAWRERG